MSVRATAIASIAACLLALSGCVFDGPDPLLYDGEGYARISVRAEEVAAAGIHDRCESALVGLSSGEPEIRVPVDGGRPGVELVGIGGVALCLDGGEPDDDGEGGLPQLDDLEPTGIGDGVGIPDDGEEGHPPVSNGALVLDPAEGPPEEGGQPHPMSLTGDPTPQPIKD